MASTEPVAAAVDGSQQSFEAAQWATTSRLPARTEYAENAVREAHERCHGP